MSKKSLIVAGSEGLIGKALVKELLNQNYNIIECDPRLDDLDIESEKTVLNLFGIYKEIIGYINCAYPIDYMDHITFFIKTTEMISNQFYKRKINGSIVNMASIYGLLGPDDRIYSNTDMNMPSYYAAAKGAIIAHSRCIATRYAQYGIRVNCIAAGGIYDDQPNEFVVAYNNRVPMQRMANVDDIVDVILFLISDKSKYITGQCIPVDGGLTAW